MEAECTPETSVTLPYPHGVTIQEQNPHQQRYCTNDFDEKLGDEESLCEDGAQEPH
jgi:hypothetical protein